MFQRRDPLPLLHRVRDFLWPRKGWRRTSSYIAHRVRRLPGTPYRIAAGFASGAAISFTPFIGLHFVGGALISLILRGSLMASAIGTVIGNPWTFPFIWAWIYTLGVWLLGGEVETVLPETLGFSYIFDRPMEILWPMTVGGLPTAVAVWFACFWSVRGAVARYQFARRKRMLRRSRTLRRAALAAQKAADRGLEET